MDTSTVQQLQKTILDWYAQQGRKLPWRATQDPYAIHVSEVMSQQTQVDRVIPYWKRWMEDIPDYATLANFPKFDLLQHRSGLGFNSRVLRLQACAKEVVDRYHGKLPQQRDQLL